MKTYLLGLSATKLLGLTTNKFLANASVWENLKSGLEKITEGVKTVSWTAFILALVVAGVAWIVGGRSAEFAKSTLGRVIIGVAILSLAAAIISTLQSTFGGGATF